MSDETKALSATEALADVATDEDKLFRDGYVKGIADFIEKCATPMTIAIQGDLGSGKTSLIKLIEADLRAGAESSEGDSANAGEYRKDIIGVVSVDAWQQFSANPKVNLFETLVGEMISRLSGTDLETMKGISGLATAVSHVVGEAVAGEKGSEDESPLGFMLSLLFEPEDEKPEKPEKLEDEVVSAADVEAFRTMFIDTLQQIAKESGKSDNSRLVVFVDGLDHVSSEVTVDLMETIKTYLDCPRCVFVLSVDEKTVFDGVRKKLGDKVDDGRKKLFFDRLVQVPFRIPSSAYNLDKYVKNLMEGKEELSGEFAAVIDILLKDPTLRCIKRCLNTMYLYQSVFGGSENVQDDSLAMLLAAVILQVESPQGFDAVVECAAGDGEHFAENLEAALGSLGLDDGINWAKLPALWRGAEGDEVDAAKRDTFLDWIRKLK